MPDRISSAFDTAYFEEFKQAIADAIKLREEVHATSKEQINITVNSEAPKTILDLYGNQVKLTKATEQTAVAFDSLEVQLGKVEAMKAKYNGSTDTMVALTLKASNAEKALEQAVLNRAKSETEASKKKVLDLQAEKLAAEALLAERKKQILEEQALEKQRLQQRAVQAEASKQALNVERQDLQRREAESKAQAAAEAERWKVGLANYKKNIAEKEAADKEYVAMYLQLTKEAEAVNKAGGNPFTSRDKFQRYQNQVTTVAPAPTIALTNAEQEALLIQRARAEIDAVLANTDKQLDGITAKLTATTEGEAAAFNAQAAATNRTTEASARKAAMDERLAASGVTLQQVLNGEAVQLADGTFRLKENAAAAVADGTSLQELELRVKELTEAYSLLTAAERNSIAGQQVKADLIATKQALKDSSVGFADATNKANTFGKGLRGLWGVIRQAAYILPGIGISGILLIAAETIKSVYDYIAGANQLTDKLKILGTIADKSNNSFGQAAIEMQTLKDRFNDAASTIDDKLEVIDMLNQKFGNNIDKINGINDAEKFFRDKSGAFIEAMRLRATAAAALGVIQENEAKRLKLLADPKAQFDDDNLLTKGGRAGIVGVQSFFSAFGNRTKGQTFAQAVGEEYQWNLTERAVGRATTQVRKLDEASEFAEKSLLAAANAAQKLDTTNGINTSDKPGKEKKAPKDKAPKMDADGTKERESALKEANEIDIAAETRLNERLRDLYKQAADDERYTLEERLSFYNGYIDAKKKLVLLANTTETADVSAHLDSLNDKEEQYNNGKLKLTAYQLETLHMEQANARKRLKDLDKKGEDETTDILKDGEAERAEIRESERRQDIGFEKDRLGTLKASFNYEYQAEKDALDKRKLSKKRYNEELKNLDNKYTGRILDAQIDQINEVIQKDKAEGIATKELQEILDKLIETRAKLGKNTGKDNPLGWTDKDRQKFAEIKTEIEDYLAVIDNLNKLSQNATDARVAGIQREIDAIEKRKQADITAYEASTQHALDSEETRARKIAEINARAQAQEDERNQKIRQEKRRQAELDKALAIAKIIINTALAVTSQLGTPGAGIGLAIATAALGAAELAVAAATPIPEFAVGTEDAPEGIAKVHRGELIVSEGKARFVDSDTLTYLKKGDVVKTAFDTQEIFKFYGLGMPSSRHGQGKEYAMDEIMGDVKEGIVKAIDRKRFPTAQQQQPAWWPEYYHRKTR